MTQWTDYNIQFVDNNDIQWGLVVSSGIDYGDVHYSNVFSDGTWIYNSYNNELEIYSASTQFKTYHVNYDSYITSLWANDVFLFLGTTTSGVLYLEKEILTNYPTNSGVYNSTTVFKQHPEITGNYINHICGQGDLVSLCTDSGIDFFKPEPHGYHSYTTVSGAQKSFILSERELYYTVSGTEWSVYKSDPITNWTSENSILSNNKDVVKLIDSIKDIKVTKSPSGKDVIFLLTNLGVLVKEEEEDIICISSYLKE